MIARFLFTAAHALFWAATDARDIRNGKNINHPVRWVLRAVVECLASVVCYYVLMMPKLADAVAMLVGCGFLFSALFRFLLNTTRGRHWAYVSPSSWYDWQFLKRTWFTMDGHVTTQMHAVIYHNKVYPNGPFYLLANHRAGTLAYIFEAVVFAELAYLSAVL